MKKTLFKKYAPIIFIFSIPVILLFGAAYMMNNFHWNPQVQENNSAEVIEIKNENALSVEDATSDDLDKKNEVSKVIQEVLETTSEEIKEINVMDEL